MSNNDEILKELIKIREAVEIKPTAPKAKPKNFVEEFREFLSKYQVMGLAVAFVMGLYLKELVQALVDDFIMPIIELLLPDIASWETLTVGVFRVGHFAGTFISFLIIAFVIFLLVKITSRMGID